MATKGPGTIGPVHLMRSGSAGTPDGRVYVRLDYVKSLIAREAVASNLRSPDTLAFLLTTNEAIRLAEGILEAVRKADPDA